MRNDWQPKPGDKFFRRSLIKAYSVKRVLDTPDLLTLGYINVGSAIYYAPGIIALVAMGAAPVAIGIAGILLIFTSLTYAEGTAMLPQGGGSAALALNGFNESVAFVSGWALMLSYVIIIAISALVIPAYLGYFWPVLKESPMVGTAVSMGIIFLFMVGNVIGTWEASLLNKMAAALNLLAQVVAIILGFAVVFNFGTLAHNVSLYWPTLENLVLGIAIAAIAYAGVETMSQVADETKRPAITMPRSLILMTVVVLLIFGSVSTLGLSAMTPQELTSYWAVDPVAGINKSIYSALRPMEMATGLSSNEDIVIVLTWLFIGLRSLLPGVVSVLAVFILLVAVNAGIMGISRLAFTLGGYRLIPDVLSRVHHRFKTPYFSIMLFAAIAILILIPGYFAREKMFIQLGYLYAFGSLLSIAIAHASIMSLRVRNPNLSRPFTLGWNIRVKHRQIPVIAMLGFVGAAVIWLVVVISQPHARWIGLLWMAVGLALYFFARWRKRRNAGQPDG